MTCKICNKPHKKIDIEKIRKAAQAVKDYEGSCKEEYCIVCEQVVPCQWLHNVEVHNMPTDWQTDITEYEMKKHDMDRTHQYFKLRKENKPVSPKSRKLADKVVKDFGEAIKKLGST